MPATLFRPCPVCRVDRATPADFRDLGETGPGRPPAVCRSCREQDAALLARHAEQVAARPQGRAYRRALADRIPEQISLARIAAHPHGEKTCPPVSGCGRTLPLDAFAVNTTSRDGLEGLCVECKAEHAALRSLKESA